MKTKWKRIDKEEPRQGQEIWVARGKAVVLESYKSLLSLPFRYWHPADRPEFTFDDLAELEAEDDE